jgi:hypothetical protein
MYALGIGMVVHTFCDIDQHVPCTGLYFLISLYCNERGCGLRGFTETATYIQNVLILLRIEDELLLTYK